MEYRQMFYKVETEPLPVVTACECDNCDWSGTLGELEEIKDCALTPGDPSPVGRCPECECIAYVSKEAKP